ncbi:hypothetical protein ACOSP7_022169 [Xanthoceras sorbifolium]|uniref:FAD-binding domain-containing protein n=1 Tax=Xanthoceras sorbifolium TaxID=99658 RepID=A0ABQ8HNY3_9ROSI|nr:hypothetical protein JRO89_XS08G0053900 [Xanthoceras sorbifolium]
MEMVEEDVVIVGAGIAGLATAVALKKVGIRALVLERFDHLRTTGAALTLFPNAWLALDALGVSHKLSLLYAPCKKGRIINVGTGSIQEFPLKRANDRKGVGPRSVHRKTLLQALADELPKGTIQFSSNIAKIETDQTQEAGLTNIVTLRMEDGTIIKTKILIGCDGVNSVVARWLGLAAPVHSGRWAARGLAVFPEGHGLHQAINQLKDVGKRAGFIPLNNKEVYWYFTTCESPPKGEEVAGNPELIQQQVIENYARSFPQEYLDIIRHSDLSTLTWTPLMFRYPWDIVFRNLSKGNITVAGDAMHPMTPDLGQGGCAALEDAVVLGRHIGNSIFIANGRLEPREVGRAIEGYVLERRWRVRWLVMGSYSLGWVQQGERKWWMKYFFKKVILIFLSLLFVRVSHYNCGILPRVSCESDKAGNSIKMD